MRILLIGGAGFIGPPAVRRLRETGPEIALFHHGSGTVAFRRCRAKWGEKFKLGQHPSPTRISTCSKHCGVIGERD